MNNAIIARPIRIIPFDLGCELNEKQLSALRLHIDQTYCSKQLTPRQKSILKGFAITFCVERDVTAYLYRNGICVIVIEDIIEKYVEKSRHFAIPYGENRKQAHNKLFNWKHQKSEIIFNTIQQLRSIVTNSRSKEQIVRKSGTEEFENKGMSYIMTLSLFDIDESIIKTGGYNNYPKWLKSNINALLDPALLYLEDSSKFTVASETGFDIEKILDNLEPEENVKDYEKHRHVDTYMSWAAVLVVGKIQDVDIEEYTALEVQLQSDWYYTYCLEKSIKENEKNRTIELQNIEYKMELLENRLYDFDDSSMPSRVLDIQRGLVKSSGLEDNIQQLKRKIKFLLEREKLVTEIKQKRIGQSTEILLFILAFIEIAPIVAQYCDRFFPYCGLMVNILLITTGLVLLIRKNR